MPSDSAACACQLARSASSAAAAASPSLAAAASLVRLWVAIIVLNTQQESTHVTGLLRSVFLCHLCTMIRCQCRNVACSQGLHLVHADPVACGGGKGGGGGGGGGGEGSIGYRRGQATSRLFLAGC